MQREFKVTVLSINKFARASLYSLNGQNNEFKTVINCHKISNASAAIGDQPTVHEEYQPVPGIKIESYISAPFPNRLAFSGENHAKKLNS